MMYFATQQCLETDLQCDLLEIDDLKKKVCIILIKQRHFIYDGHNKRGGVKKKTNLTELNNNKKKKKNIKTCM